MKLKFDDVWVVYQWKIGMTGTVAESVWDSRVSAVGHVRWCKENSSDPKSRDVRWAVVRVSPVSQK